MAIIDLNNLIQPKQVNSTGIAVDKQIKVIAPIYRDLHLDLTTSQNSNKSIGIGLSAVESRDIRADIDIQAIKNSIKNIFNTVPGQKLLNPSFGCSLQKYLFEPVSVLGANAIGNDIKIAITQFEPRVNLTNVYVQPNPTALPISYIKNIGISLPQASSLTEIGPGYAVTVAYEILPLNASDTLSILTQLGGQILI